MRWVTPWGAEWGSRRELRKQVPGADMVADFADMDSKLIGPPTFVTIFNLKKHKIIR